MARLRRWNLVQNGFARGVLDVAGQDAISPDGLHRGLAECLNYIIERDGGIRPRPRFRRHHGLSVPVPKHNAIPTAPVLGEKTHAATVAAGAKLYEIGLQGAPRSITFHGVRLESGRWFGLVDGDRRMTFGAYVTPKSGSVRRAGGAVPAKGTDEDEYAWGQFVPGRIARDIVIPLSTEGGEEIEKVEIRNDLMSAFTLRVEGVSCFNDSGPGSAVEQDAPCRLLPWSTGATPGVLALGLDFVGWTPLPAGSEWKLRTRLRSFSARQLRELTWSHVNGKPLLCHHDFPRPLRVDFYEEDGRETLKVEPWSLENVPLVPADTELPVEAGRANLQLTGGIGGVPAAPGGLVVEVGVQTLTARWNDSGADSYELEWATKAVYDADGALTRVPIPSGVEHELTGLTGGVQYAIRVRSVTGVGQSSWTEPVFAIPRHTAVNAPVLTLVNAAIPMSTNRELTLTWTITDATGVAGWELQQRDGDEGDWVGVAFEDATPRGDPELYRQEVRQQEPGDWTFRLRALGEQHYPDGDWSNEVKVEIDDLRLRFPQLVIGLASGGGRVSNNGFGVSWSTVTGATGWALQWRVYGEEWKNARRGVIRPLTPRQYWFGGGPPSGPAGGEPIVGATVYEVRIATIGGEQRPG